LTLALLWTLRGLSVPALAESDLAPTPPSLDRLPDPVVITGGLITDLIGSSLGDIFVYVYQGATPTQIPFQIDERDGGGMYVAVEDGQLDDNDELVFMAMDGGGWVGNPSLDASGTSITPTYVVALTDPISDTYAWAYIFCSAALSRTFTADYVSYDGGNDRVASPGRYAIGFNATHAFRDFLILGDSNVDLLDRDKLRITGTVSIPPIPPFSISADEEDIAKAGVHVIDGPVRVTRVSTSTFTVIGQPTQITGTLFAYRSLFVQPATAMVPGAPAQDIYLRVSMDWNDQASGMIYYDANNPAGATVDGIADAITLTPPTRWTQVSGITGTIVSVSQVPAGIGGTSSTYYKDDSTIDGSDTGDQQSFGDAGFQVDDPSPGTYNVLGHIYFLTGTTANVGATYVDYYDNPLEVNIAPFTPKWCIYLPLAMKN
jgi:hypothetical protein